MVDMTQSELENFAEKFAEIKQSDKKGIDVSDYAGKKVKIEIIEERKGNVYNDKQSYYILVKTEVLNPDEENKDFQIRASKIFSLNVEENEEGKEILTWKQKGVLANFMKAHNITGIKELIGLEVQTKLTDPNSDGIQYVTF